MYSNYLMLSPNLGYIKDIFDGDMTCTARKEAAKVFKLANIQEAQGFAKCLNMFRVLEGAAPFAPTRIFGARVALKKAQVVENYKKHVVSQRGVPVKLQYNEPDRDWRMDDFKGMEDLKQ